MKVAIIGAGAIARVHARALQEVRGVELAAACDLSPGLARCFSEQFEIARWFTNHLEMLEETNPDCVFVTTPVGSHASLAADALNMHGHMADRHWVRETRSTWLWGLIIPLIAVVLAWPSRGVSLVLLGGYPLVGTRVFRHMRRRGFSQSDALCYASFCVLAKFPQAQGVLRFWWGKLRSSPSKIIEYKSPVVLGR